MFVQTQLTSHPSSRIHHHGSHDNDNRQRRPTQANNSRYRPTANEGCSSSRDSRRNTSRVPGMFFFSHFSILLLNDLFRLRVQMANTGQRGPTTANISSSNTTITTKTAAAACNTTTTTTESVVAAAAAARPPPPPVTAAAAA
jgi:hypothetical protein